jgi:hypothetical protein
VGDIVKAKLCARGADGAGRCARGTWLKRLLLAAGIVGVLGAGNLRADDEKKEVDCKETDLGFSASGYTVKCTDLGKSTMDVDGTFGARKTDKLNADSDAEQTFLIVIDNRPIGQFFLRRASLENDVESYYSGGTFKNWTAGTAVAGFEVGEFDGESDEGSPMDCIGFRHQGARRYDGLARLVVGVACSLKGRTHSYDALKHLQAPGS